MPTYVYMCPRCGEFERHQGIMEPALEVCPTCGDQIQRVIASGTSFIMKGGGHSSSGCEREMPCCGRQTRCDRPPCGK